MALIILLTNDDGIHANGIQAMRRELEGLPDAEIWVVAPDRERSASGHAITLHRPIFPVEVHLPAGEGPRTHLYSVSGTPADCAKLGIEELLPRRPDLVISGINRGSNLGTDVLYSGTVSAAIEGTILGIPAIAVSYASFEAADPADYALAARFTRTLAARVLQEGLPQGTLLNVNVPAVEPEDVTGIAVTKLGVRLYRNQWDRRVDPRGKVYYWLAGELMEQHNDPDTDVVAVQQNKISVTPIQLDMTDYSLIKNLKGWNLKA